jgi:hypothetical protein
VADNLPGISSKLPADVRSFLQRVREFINGTAPGLVSRAELVRAGVITRDDRGNTVAGDSGEANRTPPPAPTGLTATGAMTSILVEWDAATYSNHAYTEVFASGTDDLGTAALVGTSNGVNFPHAVGAGQTRYYWIRFVSRADVEGSYNAVAGTVGQTSNNPAWLLSVLAEQLTASQLAAALNSRIDLIDATSATPNSVDSRISDTARSFVATQAANAEAVLRNALSANRERVVRKNTLAVAESTLTTLINDGLSAEAAARLTLAAQVDTNTADISSEQTARATADSALASDITTLSASVSTNTSDIATNAAAIVTEASARASADSTEATARTTLASQLRGSYSGSDLTAVTSGLLYQERIARSTQDSALAEQITLLSAGSGDQFDWSDIWYFDAGIESWDGNGTPTASSGWLRPANDASDPYVFSPAISTDGTKYGQVRMRIRKTGTPTWEGYAWWKGTGDTTWDAARRANLTEPTYDGNGIGLVSVLAGWSGITVEQIRIDLSADQDGSNYFEFDWIAIGRPAPGASSAQLADEQTARAAADSAEVTSREALSAIVTGEADPTGLTLGALTSGLIYSEKDARASADSSLASDISTLSATVSSNYTTLNSAITSEATARASADSTEVTARQALSSKLTGATDPSSLTLATLASGLVYDEKTARTSADSALSTTISSLSATVSSNYTTLNSAITSEQTARSSADATLAADITTLFSTVDSNFTTVSSAISEEATTRASADSAMASDITTLQSTVGGHTTSISTQQTTLDGISALYMVKIDNNGVMSGFALGSDLLASGTPTSTFLLSVDKFAVIAPGRTPGDLNSVPFAVLTTAQTINGVAFDPGVYIDGGSLNIGSVGNLQIADAAIDDAKIVDLAASKITSGMISVGETIRSTSEDGSSNPLWSIAGNGDAIFRNIVATGTVYADNGYFKGDLVGGAATSLTTGIGLWASPISSGANYEFRVGNTTDRYVKWDGTDLTVKAAGLTIEGGNATFSGELSAATGTFSGALSAASGTFSGDITGATGTFSGTLAAGVIDFSAFAGQSATIGYSAVVSNPSGITISGSGGAFSVTVPNNTNWNDATVYGRVTLVGGGGGGGGGASSSNYESAVAGGGGGGGGVLLSYEFAVTKGETLTVNIGNGGAGGVVSGGAGQAGTTGGTSSVYRSATLLAAAYGGVGGGGGNPYNFDPIMVAQGGATGSVTYGTSHGSAGSVGQSYKYGDPVNGTPSGNGWYYGGAGGAGMGSYGTGGTGANTTIDVDYAGSAGTSGVAVIEFYDSAFVVTNTRYAALISWLDTIGHGTVPTAAR